MQTLNIDGSTLAYDIAGSGDRTLAFVHGWCSKMAHWYIQADAFSPSHRVLRWDRRGMGESRSAAPATSARRHADDLAALADHEGIDKLVVLSHAGGGPTALEFATAHADRTEALILVDTRLNRPPTADIDSPFQDGVENLMRLLQGPDGKATMATSYASFFGPRANEITVQDAVKHAVGTPVEVAVEELRHVIQDTIALAGEVRAPVLWVSTNPQDTADIQAAFANVTIGHVVGSGHFVQLEVPEQLNPMIETFLS